mmetsp:Transcript_73653/g.108091  ORF Transcript_73653/g.108091 Transcript_73653/m.108091 type:complete len:229 (-) Transcript_73653:295-981(-)
MPGNHCASSSHHRRTQRLSNQSPPFIELLSGLVQRLPCMLKRIMSTASSPFLAAPSLITISPASPLSPVVRVVLLQATLVSRAFSVRTFLQVSAGANDGASRLRLAPPPFPSALPCSSDGSFKVILPCRVLRVAAPTSSFDPWDCELRSCFTAPSWVSRTCDWTRFAEELPQRSCAACCEPWSSRRAPSTCTPLCLPTPSCRGSSAWERRCSPRSFLTCLSCRCAAVG